MNPFPLSIQEVAQYHSEGFVVVRDLLSPEQLRLLRDVARADRQLASEASSRADGEGGSIRLVVRNDLPRDTIYGAIVRNERIVSMCTQLLGDEVYHYHHKMILKDARTGGAWAWHQDYGYWYHNSCLWPEMISCLIAVDRATRENGCLQVIPGSHRLGRLEHGQVGDQTGADPERVAEVVRRLETIHVELEPGSAVLFHCNTLHRSDQNTSDTPRWAFISCYNTRRNDPYKESRHPRYSPLEIWPDRAIDEVGQKQLLKLQTDSDKEVPSSPEI